ncbi:MAG: fibrobacter succinogenes major paralogous domain-containing protein [Bacteroidales bacterium]|nr:fibrobacter succinogenes major paralogous domain-containing protein [Bacteroidales bacterium]
MKKLILFASALCMSVCAMAQSEFYVYKKDGSSVQFTIADVDSISFTAPATGTENGHEWVDLGLSVKWATCNVGATKPEEYGNYYAWGETTTKSSYSYDNYKWSNDGCDTFTKYNTSSSYGTVDNKTVLELADDAAHANWGGAWRMPTDAEWTELRENCTWTWTIKNGVNGYEVKSEANGNSIFLPAAGYRNYDDLSNAGSYGYYWSSSLGTDYPSNAWGVSFDSGRVRRGYGYRYYGRSVRPVL